MTPSSSSAVIPEYLRSNVLTSANSVPRALFGATRVPRVPKRVRTVAVPSSSLTALQTPRASDRAESARVRTADCGTAAPRAGWSTPGVPDDRALAALTTPHPAVARVYTGTPGVLHGYSEGARGTRYAPRVVVKDGVVRQDQLIQQRRTVGIDDRHTRKLKPCHGAQRAPKRVAARRASARRRARSVQHWCDIGATDSRSLRSRRRAALQRTAGYDAARSTLSPRQASCAPRACVYGSPSRVEDE